VGGKLGLPGSARNVDATAVERLAQGFQRAPIAFADLVEEEHTLVRERDLPRMRDAAAADQGSRRCGVVRRSEWTLNCSGRN